MPKKGLSGRVSGKYPRFEFREPKNFVVIPHFDNLTRVRVSYPLLPPYAHAEIRWSPKSKGLLYTVTEPKLTRDELSKIANIEEALREVIDVKLTAAKKSGGTIEYLQQKTASVLNDLGISLKGKSYGKLMYYIVRDFVGLNEIEPMMHDPYIEDISCNGLNTPVFIIHRRFGSVETDMFYRNPEYLSDFVVKISERCGRYISYASPLLDGSLPDGSRVQASLAKDVTTKGPTFSIRKFRSNPYSPIDLINLDTVSPEIMAYLWILTQYNVSMLICGGVSTGKTTFLNAMSMFIPPENKIISIEDTRELNLPHENWVPSVSRTGFGIPESGGKRYGEVSLFDLLRESFRQNPSYVVVGEVRGREAYVMFQGMASGHASLGTIHAGSVEDVMKRLETPPIELSPSLIEALDVLIVMTNAKEKGKSARRVKEIVEIQSVDPHTGHPHTKETFSWIASADEFRNSVQDSEVLRRISFEEGLGYGMISEELQRRRQVLEWMQNHDIVHYRDVCRFINLYYKDPRTLMDWVRHNKTPFTRERSGRAEKTERETRKSARKPRKQGPPVPRK
jgi:flagellar protein FlaI